MPLEDLIVNNVFLKEIMVETFKTIFITLIGVFITTFLAFYINQKVHKKEKNQYLAVIKKNACISQTFSKIKYLNIYKYQFFTMIIIGILIGFIYFLLALIPIVFIFGLFLQSDFLSHSILFFNINPNNELNQQLILSTYMNFTLLPLFFVTFIFFYVIECGSKKMVIKPFFIKKRRLGRFIQVLRCKIWSFAAISEPHFTHKIELTRKSESFLFIFPFLTGMFLIVNFFIYFYLFHTLTVMTEQPFTFSLEQLYYLSTNIQNILPNNWTYIAYVYFANLAISILFITGLYTTALGFLGKSKHKIIKFFSTGYPFVSIKTPSGALEGKIEDVFNSHLIILNGNGVQKITFWKNIEVLEITPTEDNNPI